MTEALGLLLLDEEEVELTIKCLASVLDDLILHRAADDEHHLGDIRRFGSGENVAEDGLPASRTITFVFVWVWETVAFHRWDDSVRTRREGIEERGWFYRKITTNKPESSVRLTERYRSSM